MADNEIQLFSNVKIITTGNKPTTANLLPGQAAFGKIIEDGKYHFFGNSGEGGAAGKVVDIVLDTIESAVSTPTLDEVVAAGNKVENKTIQIAIHNEANQVEQSTSIAPNGIIVQYFENGNLDSLTVLAMTGEQGFLDTNAPVLSANPARVYDAKAQTQFRKALDVLSKSEVQTLISGVYKIKGSVESFNALINNADYTPEAGDVWNIETAGGQDSHGQDIKAGDNIVFIGPDKATDWDILAGIVDLQGYYTKTEVDGIKTDLETKITAAKSAADAAQATANQAKTTTDTIAADYVKNSEFDTKAETAFDNFATEKHVVKDANYVHTDNNYTDADKAKVDKLDLSGDGSKVVTDNGSIKTLNFNVVEI